MEVLPLSKKEYPVWDAFCADSDDAWFWHTTVWQDYTLAYRPEYASRQLSFFVREDEKTLAIVPLFLETREGRNEFSYGGGGLPTPALHNSLSERIRAKVLRFIFSHIDTLALEQSVARVEWRAPVLDASSQRGTFIHLPRFGYVDTSIGTQAIRLGNDLSTLKQGLRHGHASDITKAEKQLTTEIFGKEIPRRVFDTYKSMHTRAAGRQTRPDRTFDIQFEMIQRGEAFLAAARKGNEYAGFSYVIVYKNGAYYASGCNDEKFDSLPVAHLLQWKSMLHLQAAGVAVYEIGWQRFSPSLSGVWSEKEIAISKFMRGFGGTIVPFPRGEKYYDAAYFLEVYEKRLKESARGIVSHLKNETKA